MFIQAKHKLSLSTFRLFKTFYQKYLNPSSPKLTCFLAGHQRSGTNMIMDVVEKHYKTDIYHETDSQAFENYSMRDIPVIQSLKDNSKADVFMVKALCELDLLDELMTAFSPCKTIWMIRHYNDVTNSMVRSFSTSANFYKAIKNDRSRGEWRTRNLSDENYHRIESLVTNDISEASAAALQWAIRNLIFFEKNYDTNPDVLLINYEQVVTEPEAVFKNVYSFLGLENDARTYNKVFSSSVGKNTTPDIAPDIKELCEQVWQKFIQLKN